MALLRFVELPAPAKLNLTLRIVGRRDDGYHLLDGVMVPIDWCDTLHAELRRDGRLARHDLGPALPPDDLCLRAARALRQASGTALGADLAVDKRVPQGAGLGGGSSDAATVLLALNRLWGLDWPLARLLPIATALGADVPFFLLGTPARAEGIGERLTPMAVEPRTVLVVKPAAGLETRAVFGTARVRELVAARTAAAATAAPTAETTAARIAGFSERDAVRAVERDENAAPSSPSRNAPAPLGEAGSRVWDDPGDDGNDLQAAACELCPDVAQALALLRATCGNARMTGSGSAVFAVVPPGAAIPSMPALPDGWTGRVCRTLPEHPLRGWAAHPLPGRVPHG